MAIETMRARRTTTPAVGPSDQVAAATALAARAADAACAGESARRLDPGLASEMATAGLFRMLVPRDLGGLETDPATMVDALAEVARGDGAAGWCAMIASTTAVLSAWLPDDEARAIFGDPSSVTGGVFHPRGRAVACDGGFRVSGRWTFGSGCQHSTWLLGGALVFDSPEATRPRLRPDGAPDARLFFFPAGDVRIHDTWSTSGLRGTGSHDIEVRDLLVPEGRAAWPADPARRSEALYRFPVFGLLALGIAGVAIGIARGAIDDLVALANEKVPTGGRRRLAERSATQADVARAEALVSGARAHVRDAIGAAWERAVRGDELGMRDRALLRLAATDAVRRSAEAVDLMYETGGGSAIHDASPLSRRFRDVHVATQHVMVAKPTYEVAGRVLLGLDIGGELL
ncbi:MAG: acyl-CoA dehydrogenase family protein [Alphaproteobacteria bacterium]